MNVTDPQQQGSEARLKAVRQIGLAALSAIDRSRNIVLDGQGERTLDAIARANGERVGDEAIDSTLRGELDTYTKLVGVADRAALLAAEIEAPLLPEGWTVRETIAARVYLYQGGNAQVSIAKEADRGSMTIKVFGESTWTGYEGDAAGHVPLGEALTRARETLADPSSHLSPDGTDKVEAAKNKLDADRAEVVAVMRKSAQEWGETAERYKGALVGERFIVLDRHERAFSHFHADGEAKIKLELPPASLTGVSFMTRESAERTREHLERTVADSAPFAVWDFQQYAKKQAAQSAELGDKAAAAKWTGGREAVTLREGKELAEVAVARLGLPPLERWREVRSTAAQWDYAVLNVSGHELSVGASSGGVVSLNGDPFTPGERKLNTTLANVEKSLGEAVASLRRGLGVEVEQRTIDPLQERDYFPPQRSASATIDRDIPEKHMDKPLAEDGYVVLTISNTDNAAFVDVGRDSEVARIIDEAAETIAGKASLRDVEFGLRDTNGNRVGAVEYVAVPPTGDADEGTVRLSVKTADAAFAERATAEVADVLREAAGKVRDGEHVFAVRDTNGNTVGKFEFRQEASLEKDGVIDMNEALSTGRVYLADDGFSGIANGAHRYVVTTPDFEPGYGQGEGDVWLVNAKGEVASGYEEPQSVRETLFRALGHAEKSDLRAVAEGRVAFEDFERRFAGDDPELG